MDSLANMLICQASQVAVFNFIAEKSKWSASKINGPLFVYRRKDNSTYSIVIIDRNTKEAIFLPIEKSTNFKFTHPYIFIKKNDGKYFVILAGAWSIICYYIFKIKVF